MSEMGYWFEMFTRVLTEKGYRVVGVKYKWKARGLTTGYYSVMFEPRVQLPWTKPPYLDNLVTGPNPEVILQKLESLPSQRPDG